MNIDTSTSTELPPDFWDNSFNSYHEMTAEQEHRRDVHQRQLFFILYLEYLLWRVAKAVMELVLYADKRKQEGAFKRSKVIFPGSKTLYKWLKSTLGREDFSHEDSFTTDMDSSGSEALYLGEAFGQKKKDPEHETPRNGAEKFGEALRAIPRFFRSDASAFAFRVVAATMTLGIVCYLRETQMFFIQNRLLWVSRKTVQHPLSTRNANERWLGHDNDRYVHESNRGSKHLQLRGAHLRYRSRHGRFLCHMVHCRRPHCWRSRLRMALDHDRLLSGVQNAKVHHRIYIRACDFGVDCWIRTASEKGRGQKRDFKWTTGLSPLHPGAVSTGYCRLWIVGCFYLDNFPVPNFGIE